MLTGMCDRRLQAHLRLPAWLFLLVAVGLLWPGYPGHATVPLAPTFDPNSLVLPQKSDRIANYTMNVRLDPETNLISGWLILTWKNTTGQALQTFPFHLYHNAWKNNRSTYARESGYKLGRDKLKETDYGYTNVNRVQILGPDETVVADITDTFAYIQPDDDNPDDQTVFQVRIPEALPDGATIRFRIEFETRQPLPLARTGAIRDYHFVAQWFPKIGVFWKGAWNCHQFHRRTEFFADYGVYDVRITLPSHFVVGATGGRPRSEIDNGDGTTTYRFFQEDVHDFAWTASPHFVRQESTFIHRDPEATEDFTRHTPLKPVRAILLLQPHHLNMAEKYWTAAYNAWRYFGEWYGEYPYDYMTIVDPANDSRSGGMEYPTLFTGGTVFWVPKRVSRPEGVTVHEFGHQFWYGLVGNNEFEEAWLDEGFNTYSTAKVLEAGWEPFVYARSYFGGRGAGTGVGIPLAFEDIPRPRQANDVADLRNGGKRDVMTRSGWTYWGSYGLNSYDKPGLSLYMLERFLGEDTMYWVMRTYHHRYRFKHPTSQDFIDTVNEVTGQDFGWFFEQTWYSSNLFDYRIGEATSKRVPRPKGFFNGQYLDEEEKQEEPADTSQVAEMEEAPTDTTEEAAEEQPDSLYETTVVVHREGEAVFPVTVLMVFDNGEKIREQWDGQYRWVKYQYLKATKLKYAVVDPDQVLVMDVNPNNNSRVLRDKDFVSLATRRWTSKWMFWLQYLFEVMAFLI